MKNKAKDILFKILEIIDYQGSREEFSLKFLDLIYRDAILKSVENLTPEFRLKLDSEIKGKNIKESLEVLLKYIDKKEYEKAVERAALEMFIDYIQKVSPTLEEKRKSKLQAYLNTLSKNA